MLIHAADMPAIHPLSLELIEAARQFTFYGQPSDLLHSSLDRASFFPDQTVMPPSEIDVPERTAMVAAMVARSTLSVFMDGSYYATVSSPEAYVRVIKDGVRMQRLADRHRYKIDMDSFGTDEVSPQIVALTAVRRIDEIIGHSASGLIEHIARIEPKLKAGETFNTRQQERRRGWETKNHHGRMIRTALVAAGSGGAAIASALSDSYTGDVGFWSFVSGFAILKLSAEQLTRHYEARKLSLNQ